MADRRRCRRSGDDRGESLVEIVLTVVIIGITVTALVSGLATAATAGTAQRHDVGADTVMRNYAEATKAAVQSCTPGGTFVVDYVPPAGFAVANSPDGRRCPDVDTTQLLELRVSAPGGIVDTMQIRVRTP